MSWSDTDNLEHGPEAQGEGPTRRSFLRGAAGLVLAGAGSSALAACGASTGGVSGGHGPNDVGSLNVMTWQGYELPTKQVPAIVPWLKKAHASLDTTYITDNDEIIAKLQSGGGAGLDLVNMGQQNKKAFQTLDLLQPIDASKIPNLKNLYTQFKGKRGDTWIWADGKRYAVPVAWGVGALNYDATVVKTPPTSYSALFEPQYRGKIVTYDSVNDVFGQIAIILGINYGQMTTADLNKVKAYAARLLNEAGMVVTPSLGDVSSRFADKSAVLAFPGYSIVNVYAAQAGNKNIKFTVPKEGSFIYVDNWAIPKTASNVDGALAFINETLVPKISAAGTNYRDDGNVCVPASLPYLNKLAKSLYPYHDLAPFIAKATFGMDPPVASKTYVTATQANEAWQQLKASA